MSANFKTPFYKEICTFQFKSAKANTKKTMQRTATLYAANINTIFKIPNINSLKYVINTLFIDKALA
jgi:hypothetical protein